MAEIIDYVQGSSMRLGSGYDLLERTVKLSPLEPVKMVTEGRGPDETELSLVETSSELSQFLKVGVEGAYDCLVFKASVKSDFVEETQINQYSLLFVVHSKCVKGVEIVDQPRLNAQALGLIGNGNYNAFRNSFGDYYLSALTRGGELFGLIQISTRSESERMQLRTDLGASGISWSARAQLESRLASTVSSSSIRVKIKINGISGYSTPTTVPALFRLVEDFPRRVEAGGSPIKLEVRPVNEFPEYQQAVLEFDADTRYGLWSLSNHYLDYKMLWNNIAFMLSAAGAERFDFDTVDKDTVAAQRTKVERKLQELESLSEKLIRAQIKPDDPRIIAFMPAYAFEDTLRLPNPVELRELPTIKIFPLNHTGGDTEMAGHSPRITIDATLTSPPDRRSVVLSTHIKMQESRKDWTTFEGDWRGTAVDLRNTGLKVLDFRPATGTVRAQAGEDDHDWHWYGGTGLIKRAYCRSDVKGKETGKIGADAIEFNPFKAIVAPLERPKAARPVTPTAFKALHRDVATFWLRRPAIALKPAAARTKAAPAGTRRKKVA